MNIHLFYTNFKLNLKFVEFLTKFSAGQLMCNSALTPTLAAEAGNRLSAQYRRSALLTWDGFRRSARGETSRESGRTGDFCKAGKECDKHSETKTGILTGKSIFNGKINRLYSGGYRRRAPRRTPKKMAVLQGFEPQLNEPESLVLPLHHRTACAYNISSIVNKIKYQTKII